jgi:hypothetical protein
MYCLYLESKQYTLIPKNLFSYINAHSLTKGYYFKRRMLERGATVSRVKNARLLIGWRENWYTGGMSCGESE